MSFKLAAPFPGLVTTTILPNPQWGDGEAGTSEISITRSINGKRRTYIKSKNGRRKLSWSFKLTRNKAIELFEFMRSYAGEVIFIEDHNGRRWQGHIVTNPFEMAGEGRAQPSLQGWPAGEKWTCEFEFEGFLITVEPRNSRPFDLRATSEIELDHGPTIEKQLDNFGHLVHNWDADNIAGAIEGQKLTVWPDLGPAANDLIATIGGFPTPSLNRAPTFRANSFNRRGSVEFAPVVGDSINSIAAMETGANTTLFPHKRGTIFWVMQHNMVTNTLAVSALEFAMWSNGNDNISELVEQIHLAGASSQFMPATARFRPAGAFETNDDGDLVITIPQSIIEEEPGESEEPEEPRNLEEAELLTPELLEFLNELEPLIEGFVEEVPDNQNPLVGGGTFLYDIRLHKTASNVVPGFQPFIMVLQRDEDTHLRWRYNGIEKDGATIADNTAVTGTFRLNDQQYEPNFNGRLRSSWGQILVYNRALIDEQIESVEAFLSEKWGIPLGVDF